MDGLLLYYVRWRSDLNLFTLKTIWRSLPRFSTRSTGVPVWSTVHPRWDFSVGDSAHYKYILLGVTARYLSRKRTLASVADSPLSTHLLPSVPTLHSLPGGTIRYRLRPVFPDLGLRATPVSSPARSPVFGSCPLPRGPSSFPDTKRGYLRLCLP